MVWYFYSLRIRGFKSWDDFLNVVVSCFPGKLLSALDFLDLRSDSRSG